MLHVHITIFPGASLHSFLRPGDHPHHLQGFSLDPEEGHQSREEHVGEEAEASKPKKHIEAKKPMI